MIVVYTGRRPSGDGGAFPDQHVAFVRERLERLLAGLRPRLAVGSAAAGADLLAAAAAAAAGARVRVFTAGTVSEFRAASVADKGDAWNGHLDGLLRRDAVEVEELDVKADESGFHAVNGAVLDWARAALDRGEELVVVAVADARRSGRDHTADLADMAQAAGHLVLRINPAIERSLSPVAFVAMPYGLRKDPLPGRPDYDADATWHRILVPALLDAGYRPVRVDLEASLEIIDAKMIRGIGQARLLVADLAHHNPNVFWELGVRHAWIPAGTLLVAPAGAPRPPFDINHVTVHEYQRDSADVADVDAVAAIRRLRTILASVDDAIDSPVFAALPDLQRCEVPPPVDKDADEAISTVAETISLHADLGRADELLAVADTLPAARMTPTQADTLREQIALALLDLKRPDDALRLLRPLAQADSGLDRVLLQQRFALALMDATDPSDEEEQRLREAEHRLARLDAKHPASGETLGLLGSAAKRMLRRQAGPAADAHLDRAIDAYLRGFTADPQNYYPGVNAIALLRARAARHQSDDDIDHARALIPVVRFMIDRPGIPDSVWRRATAAEILLHEHLLDGRPAISGVVRAYAQAASRATPREVGSMRSQLALLRKLGDPPNAIDAILDALPPGGRPSDRIEQ